MEYIDTSISKNKIENIKKNYGDYAKITLDINKEILVVGCELHADGETILLDKGSRQDDIWGGGINFLTKEIDTTAILNLRPRLNNNSLEVLNQEKRERFIKIVKKIFSVLWEK